RAPARARCRLRRHLDRLASRAHLDHPGRPPGPTGPGPAGRSGRGVARRAGAARDAGRGTAVLRGGRAGDHHSRSDRASTRLPSSPLFRSKESRPEHGVVSDATSIASRPGPTSTIQAVRLDRRGLAQRAGVDEEFLVELEQYGMLAEGLLFYGAAELEITTAARELAAEGLHPRHLVMLRTSAEREAHMIGSVARPRSRAGDSAAQGGAEDFARDLGESMITLHSALLRTRLRGG